MVADLRIDIDLGGTKIATAGLGRDDTTLAERRIATPRGYQATIAAIRDEVEHIERETGLSGSVGIGMPGSISPATGLVQNANSVWLNGKPFDRDLEQALGRRLRFANDANCFALSEAIDGAAAGARVVFGIILGTGCGGGIVIDGQRVVGRQAIAGEWGHTPLPWPRADEFPGPRCWCGRHGCMEVWVSGTGLARDHEQVTGERLRSEDIAARAASGDPAATRTLERHADRLARGLAVISNILDPDVIVVGGGLSRLDHIYELVPERAAGLILADRPELRLVRPVHGDASGVRGAARLWDDDARTIP